MNISTPKLLAFDFDSSRRPRANGGVMTFAVVVSDATEAELQALMAGSFTLEPGRFPAPSAEEPHCVLGATSLREDDIWNRVYAQRFADLHGQGHATIEAAKAARGAAASAIYALRKTGGAP